MSTRRGFMRLLGMAPAGAMVAKKAAEDAVMSHVTGTAAVNTAQYVPNFFYNNKAEVIAKRIAYRQAFGVPDALKKALRRAAVDNNRSLHPDIACLRSFSVSARYRIQTDRMVAEAEKQMFEMSPWDILKGIGEKGLFE
jgi:hypothetical protein